MKKINQFVALMFATIFLCGCSVILPKEPSIELSTEDSSEFSAQESSVATEAETETVAEPEATAAAESVAQPPEPTTEALEIAPVEDVIDYFCEVVLNSEYPSGTGNVTLVQKWTDAIYYRIYGEATDEDRRILTDFFQKLNEIEGFPGIYPAGEMDLTDLSLYFFDHLKFDENFGEVVNYESADGAVQFWYYNETNNIYSARIGYRTDIDQYTRNSVLLEEVVNSLGITDTVLREDSITYQGFSQAQELSEMDWLILKLLYHPELECGMDKEACSEIIRKIYPLS